MPSDNDTTSMPTPTAPISIAQARRFAPSSTINNNPSFQPFSAHPQPPTAPVQSSVFTLKSRPQSAHTPSPSPPLPASTAPAPTPTPASAPAPAPTPVQTHVALSPAASAKRTPFRPSAPVQIPQPARPPTGRFVNPPAAIPISLPNILPSFPATLFGGLSADDEHVTVWEPHTGKTVAGNAAPYRRNLQTWLDAHPGWEEKADELKSSKRRSAARRSRSAADAFSALCCYPVATFLATDAAARLAQLGDAPYDESAMMSWTNDDFVRLQEALFRLGQQVHLAGCSPTDLDPNRWTNTALQVGAPKLEAIVVYCAHHMLTRGIAKSQQELKDLAASSLPSSFGALEVMGSPASIASYEPGPSSLPVQPAASFLERSFRAPREPRVTVWNPSNGRTISGNAAPCRRNLDAWMRQHPGWEPKEEGQLSSSRRNRNKKRPSTPSSVEPESPHFNDALEGLLFLSRSPSGMSPANATEAMMDHTMAQDISDDSKKTTVTSSVSSSSAEDAMVAISDDEADPDKMEL